MWQRQDLQVRLTSRTVESMDLAQCLPDSDTARNVRAKISLTESARLYRTLYEHIPLMYFMLGTDGTVLSVNSHGATDLGYTPDELIGRSVLAVFDELDHADVRHRLGAATARPDTIFKWETRKVRKNGTVLWVHETARAVQMEHGDTMH